ncbi:MAG: hemerythrin domain-containing protein [Nitrososphaerales archaeon]
MNGVLDNGIKLGVPESMKLEHEELHEELFAATQEPGEVGEAARRVADLLHEHFEKEEAFALPPLGLLPALAVGASGAELSQVLSLTERLKADLPEMLAEHAAIVGALGVLEDAAERAGQPRYVRFADKLRLHARTEEEVSYPTAILIGEYVKLKLNG